MLLAALTLTLAPVEARAASTPPAFTSWEETFVDPSRPTPPGATAAAPDRTLVTSIYRPTGKGPFPLIVFAHGWDGHPDKFSQLFDVWATAGYVVAAPAFPLTNATVAEQNAGDVVNQPGDMSFVLTQMLRESRAPWSRLHGAIDRRSVGAAGLSMGGAATYGVVFDDCCRDPRFNAAMVLNGFRLPMSESTGGKLRLDGHVPLLIAHSVTDPAIPYSTARDAYAEAAPPVWFVTQDRASHASQWEDDPTPYDAMNEQLTVDFWDATLRGKKAAFTRLERDATVVDLSSIEARR